MNNISIGDDSCNNRLTVGQLIGNARKLVEQYIVKLVQCFMATSTLLCVGSRKCICLLTFSK